ncbi:MAG: fibrobacter succinogenes major paralogous domain-containing protein [Alistipes sp.]|nr:fibrobacter succinogenes major paralogous domain-containing protein [Alistipes sp.]
MLSAPATGYRHRETGALANIGDEGVYWSSSSSPDGGFVSSGGLDFHSVSVNTLYVFSGRAFGFPVRCVQASAREVRFCAPFPVAATPA